MISSSKNDKVKYVARLQAERRFRWREQAFVVEGTRWLSELTISDAPLQIVFYTEDWFRSPDHVVILQQLRAPVQIVRPEVMAAMSDTDTPAGVLAVVGMAAKTWPLLPSLLLVLDGISNPGNLGTMLRAAAAAGVDGVLLGPGCVDVYNPKALRGGMGAHLRLPIQALDWPEIRPLLAGLTVWLADVGEGVDYTPFLAHALGAYYRQRGVGDAGRSGQSGLRPLHHPHARRHRIAQRRPGRRHYPL
ncbi:MAG: RNA methyltransferase [Chloroflexi bacterium]|nr:RNA methyltransferase [Chloroflexota bacterium]